MKKSIIALTAGGGLLVLVIILLFSSIGTYNEYTKLENLVAAAQVDNKNILDNTRKMVREAASVSDKEVEALENIITGYADARGGNTAGSGQLVTVGMVREAVPGITSVETLKNLQNIITAGRKDWQFAQTRLLDHKRKADDMIKMFPGSLVLGMLGKQEIKVTIVTSKETEENFSTGEDNIRWVE